MRLPTRGSIFFGALIVVLLVALACGPAATPTPTPRPQPTPTPTSVATPTPTSPPAAIPTPTPRPAPTPTPTQTPVPVRVPRGKLTVATGDVGPKVYEMFELVWPYSERNWNLSNYETLTDFSTLELKPLIATSWQLRSDGVTFKLRKGVPFHDPAYGTVTAQDVVFSYERTGAKDTKHTVGQVLQGAYSSYQATDAETVDMKFKKSDIQWAQPHRSWGNPVLIQSKKMFDEKGAQFTILNENGTGPFRVVEHLADDHINMEAIRNHWRVTPGYAQVAVLEVPEEATRIAMLKTGEADIVQIGLPNIKQVQAITGVKLVEGKFFGKDGANVYLAGQYYSKFNDGGTPTARTLDTSLPWIGDPTDAASMEKARKVRLAMSMAIDRKAIIDTILAGRGCAAYIFSVDSCSPLWQAKWNVPFDSTGAKKLLAEAGYPNGFEFTFFIPTGVSPTREEIGEALVPMWQAIGLKVKVEKAAYSARRPTMLARTIKDAWIFGHTDAQEPETYVSMMNYFTTRRVWNPGYEYDDARKFEDKLAPVLESEAQKKIISEWLDWVFQLMPDIQIASFKVPWAVGAKVKNWNMPLHTLRWPSFLETAEPAN